MKISKKRYEVPNTCPLNCPFRNELSRLGQSAICIRCPVFICHPEDMCLMKPEEYRPDWAKEWWKFFDALSRHGSPPMPQLRLTIEGTDPE